MENISLNIPNISCGHCVMAIKNEISDIPGVAKVEGNPENKSIRVEFSPPANIDKIKEKLSEINYPAE